jgi:ABC-type dipeptide/oligopeptide/nickel transport system permease component
VTRYLARKTLLYLTTFVVAVTIDWAIPRLMPGNPIDGLISRLQADSTASQELHGYFTKSFGLDLVVLAVHLEGLMLEGMKCVVMDEDADRTLSGQQVRGMMNLF